MKNKKKSHVLLALESPKMQKVSYCKHNFSICLLLNDLLTFFTYLNLLIHKHLSHSGFERFIKVFELSNIKVLYQISPYFLGIHLGSIFSSTAVYFSTDLFTFLRWLHVFYDEVVDTILQWSDTKWFIIAGGHSQTTLTKYLPIIDHQATLKTLYHCIKPVLLHKQPGSRLM